MQETLIRIKEGTFPKKYTAVIRNKRTGRIRMQPFGDQRYQHYKDRTRLGKIHYQEPRITKKDAELLQQAQWCAH